METVPPAFSATGVAEAKPPAQRALSVLAIALSLYMVYATFYGPYKTTMVHLVIFMAASFTLYFLKDEGLVRLAWHRRALNYLCVAGVLAGAAHMLSDLDRILQSWGAAYLTTGDLVFGSILVLVVLEAARRESVGFFLLSLLAILYILCGNLLPGLLGQPGMTVRRFIYLTAYTSEGIFGFGLEVVASYLFMFMLLSSAMTETKTGGFIIDLCNAFFGRKPGGPLKSAVIASAGLGTMIGSSIGNVVTTGTFTIPLMKRTGLPAAKAGAIETVASEGSQFLPPVMGAGAFVMAEITGIPYATIAVAALIPAILYFVSIYTVAHLEAGKLNLRGLSADDIPNPREVFRDFWHLLLAPAVLFYLLMAKGYTPSYAGIIAVFVAIAVAMLRPSTRLSVRQFVSIFDKGARSAARVAALIAAVGFIQQAMVTTGLGPRLTELILSGAGGTLIVTLIVGVVIATILGMGMPTPIAYILLALFVAPALQAVGVSLLAAHLFLFYFAIKSGSTPPVAVVAVVAASIAEANWWTTGVLAFLYSLPGFVVAFMFVYSPQLLMQGSWPAIILASVTATIGVVGIAVALQGWWNRRLTWLERIVIGIGSVCFVSYGLWSNLIGGLLIAAGAAMVYLRDRSAPASRAGDFTVVAPIEKSQGRTT